MDARFGYPVALDLHDVVALVVGGGAIAARKVAGLARAGARVRVVAPAVSRELEAELAAAHVDELRRKEYAPGDLDGVRLAVTATGVDSVDAAVATDAKAAGVWVNAADRREHCTFILPAIARNGPLSIAVSTDGSSPALAGRLRDLAAGLLDDDVAALAVRLAGERAAIRAAGGSTEDHDWRALIDSALDAVLPPAAAALSRIRDPRASDRSEHTPER